MKENDILNPDDDSSEKATYTINFMIQNYKPQLLDLLNYFPKSPDTHNAYRYILGLCFRSKGFMDFLGSKQTNDENMDEFIKQMNNVSDKISPQQKFHFMSLANEIASIYIQVYSSL